MKRRRLEPEFELHVAIVDALRVLLPPLAFIWHTPNGGKRGKAEAGKLKAMGTLPGFPDIAILWKGRLFLIEVKPDKGYLSKAQKETQLDMVLGGAVVLPICRSIDEAVDFLKLLIPLRGVVQ